MRETQVQSLGQEGPLEKVNATPSSVPAWKSPWTEEPGGLQSMGSRRAGHDWATKRPSPHTQPSNSLVTASGGHTYLGQFPEPPNSPPIQASAEHWAEFPVLHRRCLSVTCVRGGKSGSPTGDACVGKIPWKRSLLVINFKYSSVYVLIPSSKKAHYFHVPAWENPSDGLFGVPASA